MDKHNVRNHSNQQPYQQAFKIACESLRSADIEERAEKSGALLEKEEHGGYLIRLTFLHRRCLIHFPEGKVTFQENDEEVPLWSKILLLHYLINAQGRPLAGDWVNFRQLSGGDTYYPAFVKRSQQPLLDFFAHRLDLLEAAAQSLGGRSLNEGDRAVVIPALPRVPIALVFWSGDEEFQPEVRILFDATVPTYLSTEDVAVLAQQTVFGLIKCAKKAL
jgi:hypothetical protein